MSSTSQDISQQSRKKNPFLARQHAYLEQLSSSRAQQQSSQRRIKLNKVQLSIKKSLENHDSVNKTITPHSDKQIKQLMQTKFVYQLIGGNTLNVIEKELNSRYNWIKNNNEFSQEYHLQWGVLSRLINYQHNYAIINHFEFETQFSSKWNLTQNLKDNFDNYFPKSFPATIYEKEELSDFIKQYNYNSSINLLKWCIFKKTSNILFQNNLFPSQKLINNSLKIVKQYLRQLNHEYDGIDNDIEENDIDYYCSNDETNEINKFHQMLQNFLQKNIHNPTIEYFLNNHNYLDFTLDSENLININELNIIATTINLNVNSNELNESKEDITENDVFTKNYSFLTETLTTEIINCLTLLLEIPSQNCLNYLYNIWIIKPAGLSRGRGIVLQSSISDILHMLTVNNGQKYVLQKYIEKPLLIYNKKFDLRQWVLMVIMSDYINLYFYSKTCYLRFSTEDFNLLNFNSFIHLTNNSIQKNHKHFNSLHFADGNMWSSQQFSNHLKNNYSKKNFKNNKKYEKFQTKTKNSENSQNSANTQNSDNSDNNESFDIWENIIQPQMIELVSNVFQSADHEIEFRNNSFSLFGLDFMIDQNFQPWLIEINSSPTLMGISIPNIVDDMVKDLFDVVLDQQFSPMHQWKKDMDSNKQHQQTQNQQQTNQENQQQQQKQEPVLKSTRSTKDIHKIQSQDQHESNNNSTLHSQQHLQSNGTLTPTKLSNGINYKSKSGNSSRAVSADRSRPLSRCRSLPSNKPNTPQSSSTNTKNNEIQPIHMNQQIGGWKLLWSRYVGVHCSSTQANSLIVQGNGPNAQTRISKPFLKKRSKQSANINHKNDQSSRKSENDTLDSFAIYDSD